MDPLTLDPLTLDHVADRVAAARAATARWGARDAARWGTGLSAEGARAAQAAAVSAVLSAEGVLGVPRGAPPRRVVIWCAGNVFTAALEWTALFASLGSEVVLKASARCPAPVEALADDFAALGVRAHTLPHAAAFHLLDGADAVLGFGSDEAMAALQSRLKLTQRRSLHGHRVSFAVVSGDPSTAPGLALDAALYDGRGCMSPAAVFCLGDPEPLVDALAVALARLADALPRGEVDPALGPRWRARCGLARITGRCEAGADWAAALMPASHAEAGPLPRMLTVHAISSLDELAPLSELPLSSCATDLREVDAVPALVSLGFDRVCAPGELQRPRFGRPHDGVDVLAALSRQIDRGQPA